jgi:predicted NBD/HSP70 family sugar kinase
VALGEAVTAGRGGTGAAARGAAEEHAPAPRSGLDLHWLFRGRDRVGVPRHDDGVVEVGRRQNLSWVLSTLHLSGPSTRSALAATTGLTRTTIGEITRDLAAAGLATEAPPQAVTEPGRPSLVVTPVADRLTVLAVVLTAETLSVAVVGLGGAVLNVLSTDRGPQRCSVAETVQDIERLARLQTAMLPEPLAPVAVGVAVSGATDTRGTVLHSQALGWRDVDLGRALAMALGFDGPVLVGKDSDLALVGQVLRSRRAGPAADDVLYVLGADGVRAAIVSAGALLGGPRGEAADIAHLPVNPHGGPCACGGRGCLVTEAGGDALARRWGLPVTPTAREWRELARPGARRHPRTVEAVAETAWWLGMGIAAVASTVRPRTVILAGLYSDLFDEVAPQVRSVLEQGPAWELAGGLLPDDDVLLSATRGAADLAFASALHDPAALVSHRLRWMRDGRAAAPARASTTRRDALEPVPSSPAPS